MYQDKYGKIVSEFNQKYNIVVNAQLLEFDESLLNYKYNTLLPQFQERILNNIRFAILTAQRGYISLKVLRHYVKELYLKDFNNLSLLYKESLKPQLQNQFYFSGIGSGLKVEKVTWPFQDGFGFCIWIHVESINYDQFNESNLGVQKIISVHGQGQQGGGGIECYIMRGSVYYRIIPTIYQEPQMGNGAVYIGQLKNGMNFIGISHETQKKFSSASHLTLYFNNEQSKTMTLEYPKLNSNIALTRFTICENLFGNANCIILMNQSSTKIKTIQSVYGQLQMDYKQLKTLPACLDKYFDRIMSIYIPEFSDNNHIIDVMGNCHAIMQYKTGVLIADKNKFLQYGGFKLYYMMLNLSGTNYKSINQAQQQLILMLDILNQILKNNPLLQADAFNNQFFPTIASIIMSFEKQLITTKFIELLNETKQIIIDNRLQDQFFQFVLWNSKLHQQCENEQVFAKYLQLSCLQYLQNPQHYLHFVSSKDLLDILIFSYQDNQCCDIHYSDSEQTYQLHFFEKILYLFNQNSDISEYLIQFDNYLCSKISPCLLLQILTILKSLLVDNEDQGIKTQQILQIWNQNNIIKQLLFLFKTTPYYDIRAMIIYFLNLIFQQQFPNYKIQTHEAIQYIINAIEPLQELSKEQQQQQNNIDDLKNLGTQFLNNDYESVPQAPSMTNRRKPEKAFFEQRPPRAQSIPVPEIEKPKQPSFSVDQKGKKKFHIKIDTDAINALYNFGGEQGKKNGFDHEAFEQEMKEINRLARSCHLYMKGIREPEEPPVVVRQPLMSTKHSQAPKITQELTQIKEVSSSSMSIQKQKRFQSFAQIYNQLVGWMIDKIGVNESLMIEEGDQIKNPGIINAIMKIFQFSLEDNLKAQILQDLLCLCKSHPSNSILMLGQSKFQNDLLKILSIQEEQNLIFEIGSRLHSTLLINVLKSEFIGADYIYELLKSGMLVEQQMTVILESLNEQCKNYQCDSQLWRNTILVGLYLIETKEQYPKLMQKFSKIFEILYKHFNMNGTIEQQIQQLKNYYSEPMQQQAYQIWNFLNSKVQNYLVYEIMLELSDENNLNNLLITYAITLELSKQELFYGLNQIIGKILVKGGVDLQNTLKKIMLIINISQTHQFHSSLNNWVLEQQINQMDIEDILKNNKFQYEFIDIKVNIPQPWQMDCMVSLSKVQRDIQQFGEQKYIEIEERKTQWLYIESEKERIGRHKYRKAINSLFQGWLGDIFLQYDNSFDSENFNNPNINFKLKISKILTKSFTRPYIKTLYQIPNQLQNKPVIQTPTIAPLLLTHESDKYEQLYGQKQASNSQAAQAAVQLLNMGKAFGNNIKNAVKTIANQKQIDIKQFTDNTFKGKKVIYINGLYIINAFLSLNNINLILQIESLRQEQTHVSLCSFQLKDDKRLVKIYPIYNIVLIIKKKYLQKRNALEVFFIDGKSLFISVPDNNDLDEIAQKLLRYRKSPQAPYFQQSKTTDPIKLLDKQGYLQKWNKQQMSNFKYLLLINNLASRSYNDLTQYPIFPWIICENKEQQQYDKLQQQDKQRIYPDGQFRAMQKTMGALGNNSRIKSYIERFEQSEQGGEIPAFHYGSHYSSPAITSQYLIRLEPFTTAAREIQGGKFDISDRLFYSFIESYRCATEDIADVRELIPEIFCLPEMFLNLQNLNFGKTQNQLQVNNVILPKWCNNNPWLFVTGQRNALESEEIQKNIPEWIDLIFGFKQRGKEAEKALNIFFYVTYDSQLTLEKMEENKLSIETQIVNFGITPIQLFNKPHISRQINQDNQFVSNSQELKVYRPQNKKKIPNTMKNIIDIQQASNRAIIKIKWISDVRLMCIRKEGKIDYLKWTSQNDVQANQPPFQCGLEREKQFNFEKPQNELFNIWDISAQLQQYPLLILNQGKLFLIGGYHLGKLIMINENNQLQDIYQIHTSTITSLQSDKKETMIISGDKIGHVILWKLDKQQYKLIAKCIYFDHQSQINSIYVSTSMKLFATGCNNGIINIYNLYNGQLLRQFKHPNKYPINTILLSSRPLYSIIFFSSEDNKIYSYSINGFYLESQIEQCKSLIDCQIIRNNLFQDIMIYGTENGDLVRRSLPYLQQFKRFQISARSPVLSISHSKDKKFFICGCNDGEISVMAEPQK